MRMPIPARAAAMRLTALLVKLLTCQAIRTPSTLNAPTHYTRSRPCVLETPHMPWLQPRVCSLLAELAADTHQNPTKILVPCNPRYIPLECIR